MIKKISHVAIVVPKLDGAMGFWVDALGLQLEQRQHISEQGVDVAFLPVGESEIELLEPTDKQSGVAQYLEKRGPSMHHICFEVDDMADTLSNIKAANIPLINEEPTIGADGKKIAFIHPKGTNGVLVELYELPQEEMKQKEAKLDGVRRRVRDGREVYAAGAKAFVSRLRHGNADADEAETIS
ncbi:MAG: methylmalonyl-CoA epimerase [Chloroflexi bacterium]|nr:methylmalonyl-CoA epimerase [Chloroflexota bacterium]